MSILSFIPEKPQEAALLAQRPGRTFPGSADRPPVGVRRRNPGKGRSLLVGSVLWAWFLLAGLLLASGLEAAPGSVSFLFPVGIGYGAKPLTVNGEERRIAVAVSPLVNKSRDARLDPFIRDVTEEIIASLSRLPRLLAFRKGLPGLARDDAAHERWPRIHHSRYALMGSVYVDGKISRIGLRLIDLQTEAEVWTGSYECPTRRLLDMQDKIAEEIVKGLDAWLSGQNRGT
jgi:TolB-like protein